MASFSSTSKQWKVQSYIEQRDKVWPSEGRHILAQYDEDSVVVYQAYCPEIADYAVKHQRFGGEKFSYNRMSWIKTNFLWMMYRCGWCTKGSAQGRVLAIRITRDGFNTILSKALTGADERQMGMREKSDVRLQWDPDHSPTGASEQRRAIQLGLRNEVLHRYGTEWVLEIKDVTDFVHTQYQNVISQQFENLLVAEERIYPVTDKNTAEQIRLFSYQPSIGAGEEKTQMIRASIDLGICGSHRGSWTKESLEVINEWGLKAEKLIHTVLHLALIIQSVHMVDIMASFSSTSKQWKVQSYIEQRDKVWPSEGRHILAQYDEDSVVVYQAYCPEIADYAVKHQRFGGEKFSYNRMSWIKTNFLWMMYRCGWCTKGSAQGRVLAIRITRDGFNTILSKALTGADERQMGTREKSDVRLQWDPDHSPTGASEQRRAIQLGLRNEVLHRYGTEWVLEIKDVTDFVHTQYQNVISQQFENLLVAEERIYPVTDKNTAEQIRVTL